MCMACAPQIDTARADAFAERMIGMLNSAGLALMISIGHRTGLFDAMAGMAPATSAQIAEAAGLNERYVREWLFAEVEVKRLPHDFQNAYYVMRKSPPAAPGCLRPGGRTGARASCASGGTGVKRVTAGASEHW